MFKPIKNQKIYQQVVDQVQQMLLEGVLHKGDKLPSERDMSERFSVSRASVREALRALEIIGIVECRQGGGTYVRSSFDQHGFEPLSVMFRLNEGTFRDILEYRMLFEPQAAAMAARRVDREQAAELLEMAEKLAKAKSESVSVSLDQQIHQKIVELSGNFLLQSTMLATSAVMQSFIRDARYQISQWRDNKEELKKIHTLICEAVAGNKPTKAEQYSKKHFKFIIDNC